MKIKKNNLYLLGIILIVLAGAVFLSSNSGKAVSSKVLGNNQETQVVKLSVNNGAYVLEPSQLKKDVLVRIEADMSKMPGCSKSIVIPAFGVSKTFNSGNNAVEFVPDRAGTFNIACSMNMYKGTFSVLEPDGTKSNYVEQKLSSGGSCGMGGGCGCGG